LQQAAPLLGRLRNVLICCCLQEFERSSCPLQELLARHGDLVHLDERVDLVEVALQRVMVSRQVSSSMLPRSLSS